MTLAVDTQGKKDIGSYLAWKSGGASPLEATARLRCARAGAESSSGAGSGTGVSSVGGADRKGEEQIILGLGD